VNERLFDPAAGAINFAFEFSDFEIRRAIFSRALRNNANVNFPQ